MISVVYVNYDAHCNPCGSDHTHRSTVEPLRCLNTGGGECVRAAGVLDVCIITIMYVCMYVRIMYVCMYVWAYVWMYYLCVLRCIYATGT